MTETVSLAGRVDNARQGIAEFPFYSGPVGIRDRGDHLEVAFFAARASVKLLGDGTIDGEKVKITAAITRELDQSAPVRTRAGSQRAFVITVIPA